MARDLKGNHWSAVQGGCPKPVYASDRGNGSRRMRYSMIDPAGDDQMSAGQESAQGVQSTQN
jgi:hypothetical protein